MKGFLCAVLVSGAALCVWSENPAVVPTCPPAKVGAYQAVSNRAKVEKFDVVFFGDSITELWRFPADGRYPGGKEIWEKEFVPLKCGNFGIIADKVQNLLWRITEGKQLDYQKLKVIVLLIGINNFYQKQPQTPEEVAEGIKRVLDVMEQKQPQAKIILMGVYPSGMHQERITKLNDLIGRYADGKKIFFLDISDKLLADDPKIRKKTIFTDGVHLSPRGYQIWADNLLPLLKKLLQEAQ